MGEVLGNSGRKPDDSWVCGFWRRILALLIDALVMGVVGWMIGAIVAESQLIALDGWGRAVGFVIALIYFGLMNSAWMDGQTLGKRVMAIRVVGRDGLPISLPKSFLRYSIVGIPAFLNGMMVPAGMLGWALTFLASVVVFGGFGALLYLYVFNRRTRQSLHDVFCSTYVVNVNVAPKEVPSVWKVHLRIAAAIFLVSAVLPLASFFFARGTLFEDMLRVQQAIMNNPAVVYATVHDGSSTTTKVGGETVHASYVTVQVFLARGGLDDRNVASTFAGLVAKHYPAYRQRQVVQVVLIRGFDIGIASKWQSYAHAFNPNEI